MGKISDALAAELGRLPTVPELAAALQMDPHLLQQTMAIAGGLLSLDAPPDGHPASAADRPTTLGEALAAAEPIEDPQLDLLRERLAALPPVAAQLVRDVWGLDDEPVWLGVAAKRTGLTNAAARAMLAAAEAELRGERLPPVVAAPPPEPIGDAVQLDLIITTTTP